MNYVDELDNIRFKIIKCSMNRSFDVNKNILNDVSPYEGRLLMSIYFHSSNDEDVTASTLASQYGVTIAAIMHKLDNLEKAGYVYREVSSKDRRIRVIKLSDKILTICENLRNSEKTEINNIVECLGEEDTKKFVEILNKLVLYFDTKKE